MPSPTSATLSGPTSGQCAVESTAFTVTLNHPADTGGVVVAVTSTVGGDTITSTPFTIAAGDSSGTFTLTPSTGGNRDINIVTTPTLTVVNSPWTYLANAATAFLSGPSSGECSVASTDFTVFLGVAACAGGVAVTAVSDMAGDTLTPSSFTIAEGDTSATFTVTPVSCGFRNISITTNPAPIAYVGTPKAYNAACACPDDAGGVSRSQTWTRGATVCPEALSLTFTTTPSTIQAKDLYCGSSLLTMTITE